MSLPGEQLAKIIELLETKIPEKPSQTVYNFGFDIRNVNLPANTLTRIFSLPEEYGPFILHFKTLVADTSNIVCLPYMAGAPLSPNGISLVDLYNNGVWQANDRIWCHIYDDANLRYGLTFNVIEPVVGEYEFYIRNTDTVAHNLSYMYFKWYQWARKRFVRLG